MKAIITGVTGQDGYFMAEKLFKNEFEILGLTTNLVKAKKEFSNNNAARLKLCEFNYEKAGEFIKLVEDYQPDIIFNFAAKATGQGMFNSPLEMSRLNGSFVIEILEAIRTSKRKDDITFCQASSSEMFGNVTETPQSEVTAFWPKSPYGAAKLYAHNMINIYRTIYGVRCCSAILYNHESVRRSIDFVTKKIAHTAAQIKLGLTDSLELGSLDSKRDWGYAPEYIDAMYKMVCSDYVDDYIIATGKLSSVRDLCQAAFGYLDLDYLDFVKSNSNTRITESVNLHGNPEKISKNLAWSAKTTVSEIMVELVEHELINLNEKNLNSNSNLD